MFDFGLESFTGNAVYLEAHKQNTVNFSEASLSTGLLRFGEISMAMLLQVILPLIIFFLGFSAVASDRENGTLKILLIQSGGWTNILIGRSLGLMALALLIFVPAALITFSLILSAGAWVMTPDVFWRYTGTMLAYLVFLQVLCILTVIISAGSPSSKNALMKLLVLWLFMAILLPRTTQALGSYLYPSPSKIEFETAIEQDILKEGDSHNPDDPHYKALRDSVLLAHRVDSVQKLPFNYSGFQMYEGERISAAIYNRHLKELTGNYQKQNSLGRMAAFVNPCAAIRNISMALTGTDFEAYLAFQQEAEAYRYRLAQTMNELQMKYISNRQVPGGKPETISHEHWKAFPDFKPRFTGVATALRQEAWSICALLGWGIFSVAILIRFSQKAKAV
jgi:ABC-2 type transport system permease protein